MSHKHAHLRNFTRLFFLGKQAHMSSLTASLPSFPTPSSAQDDTADGSAFNFGRVIKLLTSKHSSEDLDRHAHALSRLAQVSEWALSLLGYRTS